MQCRVGGKGVSELCPGANPTNYENSLPLASMLEHKNANAV